MSVRIVVAVALAALITLVAALLTDNTFVALGVIALAVLGMLLLLRDWRGARNEEPASVAVEPEQPECETVAIRISPEMFNPDIGDDGSGPSSDARAD